MEKSRLASEARRKVAVKAMQGGLEEGSLVSLGHFPGRFFFFFFFVQTPEGYSRESFFRGFVCSLKPETRILRVRFGVPQALEAKKGGAERRLGSYQTGLHA